MTIVIAQHFIEGPILISDSRATKKTTGEGSDTATKILPLTNDCIVGIVGNPYQAAKVLISLRDDFINNPKILIPEEFNAAIIRASEHTELVSKGDPRCRLIFCYLDRRNRQNVPVNKLRHHWNKVGRPIIPGEQAFPLVAHLMSDKEEPKEIDFNFPKSHIVELTYPSNTYTEVELLDMDVWGYASAELRDRLRPEFYRLWSLESYGNVPWFKSMIAATVMEDIIREEGQRHYIGGLPQVVALTPKGILFQSYSSGSVDQDHHTTMKYVNGSWEQIDNKSGKIVKTAPGIFGSRNFDPSEIVDFNYFE